MGGPASEGRRSGRVFSAQLVFAALVAGSMLLAGCMVGPKYVRPPVETPVAYKELGPADSEEAKNWKTAQPNDGALRGKWWEVFNDPQMNELEEKVSISNQSVAAAAASFLAARAMVREARSHYFPTVTTAPSVTHARPSPGQFGGLQTGSSTSSGPTVRPFTNYALPFEASWEPDLWGRVRSAVRANAYAAQVSFADLENVRLAAQAELAVDYYELRGQDALKQLFDSTVTAYRETLEVTQVQYKAGVGSDEAVAQAEAQLRATEAQDTNLAILRAQYEHAVALLIGQPASSFSLPPALLKANPPAIPVGIPGELLERRPDIAAAERSMAQANAQIGVAKSAYFPNVLLSGTAGLGSVTLKNWFTWPSRFWSVGPSVAETIFDAGLRGATVQQFRATYDGIVANYRQAVLTAFQQVEDNLAALRILAQDIQQQEAAIQAASRSLAEATVRYKSGIDPYLNVISAQTVLLADQQTAVNFRTQQLVATVQLVKALGGGWDASKIPPPKDVAAKISRGQQQ